MPVTTLRIATASDVEELLDWMGPFNESEGIAFDADRTRDAVLKLLGDPRLGEIDIFAEDGADCGYAVWTTGYDLEWGGYDAFLTEIYVPPAHRGTGIGRRAMELIEGRVRAFGAAALHLMVRPENEHAVKMYARAGFSSPPRTFLTKAF